jgi:perosamine synthetase
VKEPRRQATIAVSEPALVGRELEYVQRAVNTGRLSMGPFVEKLERAWEREVAPGPHALACCNGTAALHLALLAVGCGPGDLVLVPSYTYVATANAVAYCGARPVFCDVNPLTWTADLASAEAQLERWGGMVKGVIAVHLYAALADLPGLRALAGRHGCWLVEDAAEAAGAGWEGAAAGTWGDAAAFSLYGNKTLTSGEGGMVALWDGRALARARLYRGQGQGERRYWHEVSGYNYRMTDLQAAVALAQVEKLRSHHASWRCGVLAGYQRGLRALAAEVTPQAVPPQVRPAAPWMTAVRLAPGLDREAVARDMAAAGVETRPGFTPLHLLPMWDVPRMRLPVAEALGREVLCLPTHAALHATDVSRVCWALAEAVGAGREAACAG